MERVANACVVDLDGAKLLAPCILSIGSHRFKVKIGDFSLGVAAGLSGADERESDSSQDLVVGWRVELSPGASRQDWALAIIISAEALAVGTCAVVYKDACVAKLRALKVCTEIQIIITNTKGGPKGATAGYTACVSINRDD